MGRRKSAAFFSFSKRSSGVQVEGMLSWPWGVVLQLSAGLAYAMKLGAEMRLTQSRP